MGKLQRCVFCWLMSILHWCKGLIHLLRYHATILHTSTCTYMNVRLPLCFIWGNNVLSITSSLDYQAWLLM